MGFISAVNSQKDRQFWQIAQKCCHPYLSLFSPDEKTSGSTNLLSSLRCLQWLATKWLSWYLFEGLFSSCCWCGKRRGTSNRLSYCCSYHIVELIEHHHSQYMRCLLPHFNVVGIPLPGYFLSRYSHYFLKYDFDSPTLFQMLVLKTNPFFVWIVISTNAKVWVLIGLWLCKAFCNTMLLAFPFNSCQWSKYFISNVHF